MEKLVTRQVSKTGLERLVQEILRQAVYDWQKPEYQGEVNEFFRSDWAEELTELFHISDPKIAVSRLEAGVIDPKDFHAAYIPNNQEVKRNSFVLGV